MNGKERMNNILDGKSNDRIPWVILPDRETYRALPEQMQHLSSLDLYQAVGCDTFQFGNFLVNCDYPVKYPYKAVSPSVRVSRFTDESGRLVTRRETPWGCLTAVQAGSHPVKYPVKTVEELRLLIKIWQDTDYITDEDGFLGSCERMEQHIDENGIYIPIVEPSAVQKILEEEAGIENFYYLLHDHTAQMEELLSIMHAKRCQEYRFIAERMPFRGCISVENTSTAYISPKLYEKYSLPHICDFTDIMHEYGKKSIIHMCGAVRRILPILRGVGIDGIHALTPPPVGDEPFEDALDVLGEKLVIYGIQDGTVFHRPEVTRREIDGMLEAALTPRLRDANFVLCIAVDGIPTPLWKLEVVREYMEKCG